MSTPAAGGGSGGGGGVFKWIGIGACALVAIYVFHALLPRNGGGGGETKVIHYHEKTTPTQPPFQPKAMPSPIVPDERRTTGRVWGTL